MPSMCSSIALVALLARSARCARPSLLPESVSDPLAYYYMDEGQGVSLRDFVSGADSGSIIYHEDHQTVAYTGPNWTEDDTFGTALQCGKKENEVKDTVELADVDYGHSGEWTLSLWFRHDPENFEAPEREQLIGHGDALNATSSANQFHVQLELSQTIRTIVYEISTDTPALPDTHDTNWHHYVFVANPPTAVGGYAVFIDGVFQDAGYADEGAFDPDSTIRLCGRLKPASWADEDAAGTEWDAERYFLGKVAHFAVWDSSMTQEQITEMYDAYGAHYTSGGGGGSSGEKKKKKKKGDNTMTMVIIIAAAVVAVAAIGAIAFFVQKRAFVTHQPSAKMGKPTPTEMRDMSGAAVAPHPV